MEGARERNNEEKTKKSHDTKWNKMKGKVETRQGKWCKIR